MNNKEKKKRIFELFSQNLEWVKEHESVEFAPDFRNGVICPICFNVFFEKDLDVKTANPLTLEDVPPVSLGGKPLTLTCKSCNSKCGNDLDVHLLNILLENDSKDFLPNSLSKASFKIDDSKVNGTFGVGKDGVAAIRIEQNVSNPKHFSDFTRRMSQLSVTKYNPIFHPDRDVHEEWRTPNFLMNFNRVYNERRANVALLRIAYLIAYANFGSAFFINPGLYKVREQILNPDKNILGNVFWLKYEFPDEMVGLNIVSFPKELHSFLIIFDLHTKGRTKRCGIVLPGPSSPACKVYEYIENSLCVGDGSTFFNFTVEHLIERNYLKNKEYTFDCLKLWQRYTHPDYKPKINENTFTNPNVE